MNGTSLLVELSSSAYIRETQPIIHCLLNNAVQVVLGVCFGEHLHSDCQVCMLSVLKTGIWETHIVQYFARVECVRC